jgi:hypothetical protein
VHAGTTTAGGWTVFEAPPAQLTTLGTFDVLGRFPHGSQIVVTGPRLDYPSPLPVASVPSGRDIAAAFSVTGDEPTVDGIQFVLTATDNQSIKGVRDGSIAGQAGFGGPILVYSSPRRTDQVVFIAMTGSNSLMAATPAQFGVTSPNPSFVY